MNKNGRTGPVWTEDEDEIVCEMYASSEWAEILAALPRRTRQAVRVRANSLCLTRGNREPWKTTEIALLKQLYETTMPMREIVVKLAPHTTVSVHKRAAAIGLRRPRTGMVIRHPAWERLSSLLEEKGPLSAIKISEALGISESAVYKLRDTYREKLRVAGYLPPLQKGKWKPLIGLADGRPDAIKPFKRRTDGLPKSTMATVPARRISKCWDTLEEAA